MSKGLPILFDWRSFDTTWYWVMLVDNLVVSSTEYPALFMHVSGQNIKPFISEMNVSVCAETLFVVLHKHYCLLYRFNNNYSSGELCAIKWKVVLLSHSLYLSQEPLHKYLKYKCGVRELVAFVVVMVVVPNACHVAPSWLCCLIWTRYQVSLTQRRATSTRK